MSLEYYIIFNIVFFFITCKVRDYIKEASMNTESKWTKFWNLYSNVEEEHSKTIRFYPFLKLYSLYSTLKVVAISDINEYINKKLLQMLRPINLKNKKFLVPLFIHDTKYYLCIEQVSDVRNYDIIDVSPNKYDLKKILNRFISTNTSPYKVGLFNPRDLGLDEIQITQLVNNDFNISVIKKDEFINI